MKFRNISISEDFCCSLISNYSIVICLNTKHEDDKFSFTHYLCEDDDFYRLIDLFGKLEVSSLKFADDCVYVNFNLDQDLFLEFKNLLEKRGF